MDNTGRTIRPPVHAGEMTRERVRQIESRALSKLRHSSRPRTPRYQPLLVGANSDPEPAVSPPPMEPIEIDDTDA